MDGFFKVFPRTTGDSSRKSRSSTQLKDFFEESMVAEDCYQPDGANTFVSVFRPVQGKRPTTGQWVWIVRPNMAIGPGRDIQGTLSYWATKFNDVIAPIRVQKDRVPSTGLFKAVEGQLQALQI